MGIHTPPIVPALLTVAFIVFLFRRDIRESANVTAALWLPVLWILIGCSRSVSQWLGIFGLPVGGASSTSLVSLLLGMLVMAVLGLQSVKRSVTFYLVTGVCVTVIAELAFGISDSFIALLHKDPTLTERTPLGSELLKMKTNPIIGVGFESFWLGERRAKLWSEHYWQPNEAHNGYLETYLNLGLMGLFILIGLIIASYRKARRELFRNFEWARYRLGFLAAVVTVQLDGRSPRTV